MGRRPSDAPERLTNAAAVLLQEQGYHATGIKDVASAAGVPMGSLYFHFPGGKHEIAERALDASGSAVDGVLADVFTFAEGVRPALTAYIAQLAAQLEQSGYRRGCPIATTALEVGAHDDALAATSARWFASWGERIVARLVADGYEAPEPLATLIVSAIEGAMVLARVQRSTAALSTVGAVLDTVLAAAPRSTVATPATPATPRRSRRT